MNVQETLVRLEPAIRSAARIVKRHGWTLEDCRQQAAVALLALQKIDVGKFCTDAYYGLSVRRAIVHAAKFGPHDSDYDYYGSLFFIPDPCRDDAWRIDFADLIASAPLHIRRYLEYRVLDGETWEQLRDSLQCSNDTLTSIRRQAADWLLAQYEGRKV